MSLKYDLPNNQIDNYKRYNTLFLFTKRLFGKCVKNIKKREYVLVLS